MQWTRPSSQAVHGGHAAAAAAASAVDAAGWTRRRCRSCPARSAPLPIGRPPSPPPVTARRRYCRLLSVPEPAAPLMPALEPLPQPTSSPA